MHLKKIVLKKYKNKNKKTFRDIYNETETNSLKISIQEYYYKNLKSLIIFLF